MQEVDLSFLAAEFEKIQTAKDTLCDDEKRAMYDKWRHAGISMSFRQWCNLRGAAHTVRVYSTSFQFCELVIVESLQ